MELHVLLPLYLLDYNHSLPFSAFLIDSLTKTVETAAQTVPVPAADGFAADDLDGHVVD